ncbi:hypothetical protein HYH03_000956 [Edaphochlamys debaryana]|uniref:Uncharacterized protein n=1 Tax=Edaphochlamys debaryana TaxID=47281 RepID=A0A835YNV0_9CHLO|nr:hypothetical protein HYH03_000956 [Edaphochlamys debaryana]|eukprot:KAG2501139.1 hypothetical protein HYH03_000956 [Edaphochlamys debaryana]
MGNANGTLVNKSHSPIVVQTFNQVDRVHWIHKSEYTVPPGARTQVEAAADFWGLWVKIKHPLESTPAIFICNGQVREYAPPPAEVVRAEVKLHELCVFKGGSDVSRTFKVKHGFKSDMRRETINEYSNIIKAAATQQAALNAETTLRGRVAVFSTEHEYGETEDTITVSAKTPAYVYLVKADICLDVGNIELWSPTVIQSPTPLLPSSESCVPDSPQLSGPKSWPGPLWKSGGAVAVAAAAAVAVAGFGRLALSGRGRSQRRVR